MNKQQKILIVEDEAIAALVLSKELEWAGYKRCFIVSTGEDSIAHVQKDLPDLILMDIRLAGELSGIHAAHEIKKIADIPIIIMTGYDINEIHEQVKQLNPIDFLLKPIKIQNLINRIDLIFSTD